MLVLVSFSAGSVMLVQKKKQVADYRESRKRHRDKGMGV